MVVNATFNNISVISLTNGVVEVIVVDVGYLVSQNHLNGD